MITNLKIKKVLNSEEENILWENIPLSKLSKAEAPEGDEAQVCEVVLEVEDVEVDEGEDEAEARLVDVHG